MGDSRPVTAFSGASSRPSRPPTADAGGYVGEHNLLQDEDHLIECDNVLVRFVACMHPLLTSYHPSANEFSASADL
jgi:hypothetical protein